MFTEEQTSPRGLKITAIVVLITCVAFAAGSLAIGYATNPDSVEPIPVIAMMVGLPLILFVWMLRIKQTVIVTADQVQVKQHGIMWKAKVWPAQTIKSARVRSLNTFGEFGGWGIRYGFNKKWGYVLAGTNAIELELTTGKKAVISVVDKQGAVEAIERLKPRLLR